MASTSRTAANEARTTSEDDSGNGFFAFFFAAKTLVAHGLEAVGDVASPGHAPAHARGRPAP